MIPLESFAPDAQKLFLDTREALTKLQHRVAEPEHFLSVMLDSRLGNVTGTLRMIGVDASTLLRDATEWVQRQPRITAGMYNTTQLVFSDKARCIIERAIANGSTCVDEIFKEMCREKLPILLQHGVTIERLNYVSVPEVSFSEQEQRRLDFQRWLWQKQRCEFSVGLYPLQGVEQ